MRGIGFKLDDDEKVVQEVQKVAHENGERLDKDVRTLHGSVRRHRKELDAHTETLNKMEERIEGLCRVVNKQTNTIRELREAVDANDNIIANQQEWIIKIRGRRECNCGAVDPLLATVLGEVIVDSEGEEDAEGEIEYADEDPGTSLDAGV